MRHSEAAIIQKKEETTSQERGFFSFASGTIYANTLSGKHTLVEDVSFTLQKGEKLSLIGETGSGKTMIALALMGRLPRNVKADGYSCSLDGRDLSSPKMATSLLGREIAYIPQNGMEFLNPSRTIKDHLYDSLKRVGVRPEGRRQMAEKVLDEVGFYDKETILKSYPFQLSGGMAQRITVALALCTNAKLIIADEPTNGLDEEAASRMLSHLGSLFPSAAKIFITHDIQVASNADRLLILCGGRAMEQGPCSFLSQPASAYSRSLLAALVKNGMQATPTLRQKEGCPFSDRCPEYRENCKTQRTHHKEGEHEWWCNR